MLIIYFIIEFLVREFFEIFSLGKKYLIDVWNYYEWTLITVSWFFIEISECKKLFITVVAIRIRTVVLFGGETLAPAISDFVNLHKYADLVRSEREVMAALVIFCYLRALKFLVIPPATGTLRDTLFIYLLGPHTNSILQTMRARSFVVFIGFLIVVIFTFALSFHLAFGFNLVSLSNFGVSL